MWSTHVKTKITSERLLENGHFSKAQIEVVLRYNKTSNPNAYSKNWTKNDYLIAKQLHGLRAKSLEFVRKIAGLPLPSESTIQEKFKFMNINMVEVFMVACFVSLLFLARCSTSIMI